MNEKKWFAVYTRPHFEKRVAESLAKKGIEHYCPLNRTQKQLSDRAKVLCEPLFTSYVFVNISAGEQSLIAQINGVINFVYWLGKPVVIKNEEISAIRHFLQEYSQLYLEKTEVNLDDQVRIINDPTIMRKGNLLEVRNATVKVVLPSLGHVIVAEVKKENAEKISLSEQLKIRV